MNVADFFLLCVQTAVLKSNCTGREAMDVLDFAAGIPLDALGATKVPVAAGDLVWWKTKGGAKPKWLEAYELERSDRVLVRRGPRCERAERWWGQVDEALADSVAGMGPICPASCAVLITEGTTGVVVKRADAALFRAWVQSIVGHDDYEGGPFEAVDPAPEET